MDATIQLWLLQIRSLIADKEMEVAAANREVSLGGNWLSDHNLAINEINKEINYITDKINQYK